MTEKIGLIKNPLTIIAIFAGIAEVSGTIVLPFVSPENQRMFIWFLITFPSALVLFFFLILIFRNHVLYAPSDFQNEATYMEVNRFNKAELKEEKVKVDKVLLLDEKMDEIIRQVNKFDSTKTPLVKDSTIELNEGIGSFSNRRDTKYFVANFVNVMKFMSFMAKKAIYFDLYMSPDGSETVRKEDYAAIWLGAKIELVAAKNILSLSREFYPHLKYIYLSFGENTGADEVFIGGSTQTAINKLKLKSIDQASFNELLVIDNIVDFHLNIQKLSRQID